MKKFFSLLLACLLLCAPLCGSLAEEEVSAENIDNSVDDIQDSVISLDELITDDEDNVADMDEVSLEDLVYEEEVLLEDPNSETELIFEGESDFFVPDDIPMASESFTINNVILPFENTTQDNQIVNGYIQGTADYSGCYALARYTYGRLFGIEFNQRDSFDFVTPKGDVIETNEANLKEWILKAGPGAVLRVTSRNYWSDYDNSGHSIVIVDADENGAWLYQAGANGLILNQNRVVFYSWGDIAYKCHNMNGGFTNNGQYIKYIKYPGRDSFVQKLKPATNLYFKDVVYPQTFRIDTTNGWNLSGGTLASNYDLTSIKSLIVDSNGNTVSSGSQSISGKYYSVRGLDTFSSSDNGVKFSYIGAEGSYKWILIATDSNGRTLRLVMPFTAVSGGSTSTTTAGKEYADYYKVKSENVTYKVIKDVTARKKPFDDAEKGSKYTKGKKVVSVAIVMNKYNNLWIQTNDNQYIYSGYHVEENDTVTQKGNQYFEVDNGGSSPTWAASLASIFGILNVNAKPIDDTPQDDTSHGGGGKSFDDSGSQQSEQWTYRVTTTDGLNMRSSASTSGAYITTLWPETTVRISQKTSADGYTWGYGTSSNGYTGWIVVDNNWTALVSADSPVQTHTHTPVTDAAVPATCTEAGKTEGSHCSSCGEVLTVQQTIPATGHKATTVKGTAATCTQTGLTDGSKCSVCRAVLVAQETIPATGHKATTVKGTAATCTQTGLTDGSKCSVCGTILTAQKTIPATGHTPVTDPAVAATCTAEGKTEGSHCAVCNAVLVAQQIIPATGHTPVVDPAVAPAYGVEGRTEGSHCAVCGAVLVAQQPIPALTYQELALSKVKSNGTITLNVGEQRLIVPEFATASGWTVNGYKSSKPAVVSIDGNGLLTASAEGKAKITVTTNEKKKATLTVKVVDPYKPTAIAIAQGKAVTIAMGQPLQLNAVLAPESARATLAWASNKPKVATVDGNGLVTPVGEGKAKITVRTQNKKKATIAVQVVDPNKPLGIAIAQGKSITLKVGESVQLGVGLNPATAQSALTWKTNKPAIANVDANGVVTALKKGKAKITVMTYNKKKATIAVNVVE